MEWSYNESGNYWSASRDYGDGCCSFIYTIFPMMGGGYVAEAMNNAYGAERVAVKSKQERSMEPSVFYDLNKLMSDIEERKILWLYTGYCSCVGKVTREEY